MKNVLIETYWNVKNGISAVAIFSADVLIETYWNVKSANVIPVNSTYSY